MHRYLSTIILLIGAAPLFAADNWPEFRGPYGNGLAESSNPPLTWSESENVKWKTAIPGRGWSSPIVWDNQVWVTTATEDGSHLSAVCVDCVTGKVIRNANVFDVKQPEPINKVNSYASPSPVIEPGRIYVHFGTTGTACLDTSTGKKIWERCDLKLEHKEGPGSSPILHKDLIIVHCDGMDVQYIVALDKKNGQTVWKTNRSIDLSDVRLDFRKAYSTPLVVQVDGQAQIVSTAAQCVYGYDPVTGREIWRLPYSGFSNVSRPVTAGGNLYLNTGYIRPQLWAMKLGARGELDDSAVHWKFTRGVPAKPSVLLVKDLIYMISDKGGVVTCVDVKTGEEVWTKRLGGNYSASPVFAGGRIYFFDHDGTTTVIKPGREYHQLAVNELADGFMASPAVVNNSMYVRTRSHLYRIEE